MWQSAESPIAQAITQVLHIYAKLSFMTTWMCHNAYQRISVIRVKNSLSYVHL